MTVSPSRASEILAAYGADPLRWPEAERADALLLVERLPSLGYERRLAGALDVGLVGWAREALPADRTATERAVARAVGALPAPARLRPRAWMGGALAASAAAILAVTTLHPFAPAPAPADSVALRQNDSAVFRTVFVPTQEEEDVLL